VGGGGGGGGGKKKDGERRIPERRSRRLPQFLPPFCEERHLAADPVRLAIQSIAGQTANRLPTSSAPTRFRCALDKSTLPSDVIFPFQGQTLSANPTRPSSGDEAVTVLEPSLGSLGPPPVSGSATICSSPAALPDAWRSRALDDPHLPSAFSQNHRQRRVWHVALRAPPAIENACFVVAPGRRARNPCMAQHLGHSLIVGPWAIIPRRSRHPIPVLFRRNCTWARILPRFLAPACLASNHDRPFASPS